MKFLVVFLLLLQSSYKIRVDWYRANELLNIKLEVGDIIVRRKGIYPLEWFGHTALVVANDRVVEFPNLSSGFSVVLIKTWIEDSRDIKVFRSKEGIQINNNYLNPYVDKSYKLVIDRESSSGYYCSQFIWHVYNFSYNIDLLPKHKNFILPYDFLNSSSLKEIKI